MILYFVAWKRLMTPASQGASHANRVAYREWRASTFEILFPGKGNDIEPAPYMRDELDSRVKNIEVKIWRSSWRYAYFDKVRVAKREARDSLKEIVVAAICLDLDMKKHTTEILFETRSCYLGAEFASERMERTD